MDQGFIHHLYKILTYGEADRNRIYAMRDELARQNIPGQTAMGLAGRFANNPDMTAQQTQFLAALKSLGYLPHQAQ